MKKSRSKRLGIILAVLMVISLLIVFLNPVIFPRDYATYKDLAMVSLFLYYPMDVITYLLPFIGIVYLTIVIPKDKIFKIIRYIVMTLTIIILCFIIYRRIYVVSIKDKLFYEDIGSVRPEMIYPNDPDGIRSGYNIMDFITGK